MYIEKGTGQVIVPEDEWTIIRLTPWQLQTLKDLINKSTPRGYPEKMMASAMGALKVGDKT